MFKIKIVIAEDKYDGKQMIGADNIERTLVYRESTKKYALTNPDNRNRSGELHEYSVLQVKSFLDRGAWKLKSNHEISD